MKRNAGSRIHLVHLPIVERVAVIEDDDPGRIGNVPGHGGIESPRGPHSVFAVLRLGPVTYGAEAPDLAAARGAFVTVIHLLGLVGVEALEGEGQFAHPPFCPDGALQLVAGPDPWHVRRVEPVIPDLGVDIVDELEDAAGAADAAALDERLDRIPGARRAPTPITARVAREHPDRLRDRLLADHGHIEVLVIVADVDDRLFTARLLVQPLDERALGVIRRLPAGILKYAVEEWRHLNLLRDESLELFCLKEDAIELRAETEGGLLNKVLTNTSLIRVLGEERVRGQKDACDQEDSCEQEDAQEWEGGESHRFSRGPSWPA